MEDPKVFIRYYKQQGVTLAVIPDSDPSKIRVGVALCNTNPDNPKAIRPDVFNHKIGRAIAIGRAKYNGPKEIEGRVVLPADGLINKWGKPNWYHVVLSLGSALEQFRQIVADYEDYFGTEEEDV